MSESNSMRYDSKEEAQGQLSYATVNQLGGVPAGGCPTGTFCTNFSHNPPAPSAPASKLPANFRHNQPAPTAPELHFGELVDARACSTTDDKD
jgi:hypothetical protein